MKIAICGYDEQENEAIGKYIGQYCSEESWDCHIDKYGSLEEIRKCFAQGLYHIIFLDVCSKGKDAVEFAEQIRGLDKNVIMIFITLNDDYFEDGYKLGVLNYIVRPVEEGSVRSSIRRASKHIGELRQTIEIIAESAPIKIRLSDIQYIEAKKHTSIIHTNQFLIKTHSSLNELEKQLAGRKFLRSHVKYLVNMDAISQKDENRFTTVNGDEIPISPSLKTQAHEIFNKYKI